MGGSDPRESIVASHGKLNFFCALHLSELSIDTVVDVIIDERCSYIVATPKNFDVEPILDVGWSGSLAEDFSLCGRICERRDCFLIRLVSLMITIGVLCLLGRRKS